MIDEKVYRIGFISALIFARRRLCLHQRAVFVRWESLDSLYLSVSARSPLCVRERGRERESVRAGVHESVRRACWDVAALSAMSGTASSRVAAGENDDDEIKIPRPAEGAAAISLAAVRIDLFQHLTFNHDKTVGKLIVLQDIRHQSPLILSGAPRRMNTNRLSRQPSHPSLPSSSPSPPSSLFFLSRLLACSLQIPCALLFLCFPPVSLPRSLLAYFCPKSFFFFLPSLVSVGFISPPLPR